MSDPEKTVFVSYRRDVSSFIARAVFQDLRAHGYEVFMDVESIDSGAYDTVLLNQIAARAHFVLILTPGTLERCNEPDDWLRREIEQALELKRNIVPLMVDGFRFDDKTKPLLSGRLSELARFNALNLPHDYFDAAMDRLRSRFLKQPVPGEISPTPPGEESVVQRKIERVDSQTRPTKTQLAAEDHLRQGKMRFYKDDLEGAIAAYTEAIRLNPQFADAYYCRGMAYYEQGDMDRAVADYSEATRLSGEHEKAESGRTLDQERGDQRDKTSSRTVSRRPKKDDLYASAYHKRGVARRTANDLEGAIADFTQAILLDPLNSEFYNDRGGARYHQGDYEGAIGDYHQAQSLNPEFTHVYCNNRGEVYFALGQYEQALAEFKKANELKPGHNFAIAGLAITAHVLGEVGEAKRLWRLLIAIDKKYKQPGWVRETLQWVEPLVEEARKLIKGL